MKLAADTVDRYEVSVILDQHNTRFESKFVSETMLNFA